jgi:hypothetical protein
MHELKVHLYFSCIKVNFKFHIWLSLFYMKKSFCHGFHCYCDVVWQECFDNETSGAVIALRCFYIAPWVTHIKITCVVMQMFACVRSFYARMHITSSKDFWQVIWPCLNYWLLQILSEPVKSHIYICATIYHSGFIG